MKGIKRPVELEATVTFIPGDLANKIRLNWKPTGHGWVRVQAKFKIDMTQHGVGSHLKLSDEWDVSVDLFGRIRNKNA